jgi:hypothetical protein
MLRSTGRIDIDGLRYRADVLISRKASCSKDLDGVRSNMDIGYEMDEKIDMQLENRRH